MPLLGKLPQRLRAPLFLAAVAAAMLGPFLGKPLYIDDAAHVAMARDLPKHPWRPYDQTGAEGAWERFGWVKGQAPSEANPPAYHYWTALWGTLLGWSVPGLHAVFLLLAVLTAWAMYAVAVQFTAWPLEAALLFMLSPAFWLTSSSLLIDNCLLPCGLGALALIGPAQAELGKKRALAGAVLLGLAPLVKYTGLLFWPLIALWWLLQGGPAALRRRGPLLALPAAMFALWCLWSRLVYGAVHVTAIAGASWTGGLNPWLAPVFFSFFSGSLLFPLLVPAAAWQGGWAGPIAAGSVFGGLFAFLISPRGGYAANPGQAALLTFFLLGTAVFFLQLALRRRLLARPADRMALAWLALGSAAAFARGSGGWFAGRYFLIALPAAALAACRILEPGGAEARGKLRAALLVMGLFGLLLAKADEDQARVNLELKERLSVFAAPPGGGLWYPSYALTGLGAYLRPLGWKPADSADRLKPGDLLIVLSRALPSKFQPIPLRSETMAVWDLAAALPLRTFDPRSGAGFYGSLFGPLPFSFSRGPLERAVLVKAL